MKVYSWNMLFRNREQDRAFEFIAKCDFDIFCLQEVPEEFLPKLKSLPYQIAYRSERELLLGESWIHNYVVILSKHPIVSQHDISFSDSRDRVPLRTHFFVRLLRQLGFTKIRNRGALYVDISVDGTVVRIFNLHLTLEHPALRLEEFDTAMLEIDPAKPTIVCGDFNILEKLHITPLNWMLGGRVSDTLFHTRERTIIEKRFLEHGLFNPLRGKKTQTLSVSQLDHILISRQFSIKNATVLPARAGSDHNPVYVETSEPTGQK